MEIKILQRNESWALLRCKVKLDQRSLVNLLDATACTMSLVVKNSGGQQVFTVSRKYGQNNDVSVNNLQAGRAYSVELGLYCHAENSTPLLTAETRFTAVTPYTQQEVARLQAKAERHLSKLSPEFRVVERLQRCKPEIYFTNIRENRGGIMESYLKDWNGDPRSSINNAISGLFFEPFASRHSPSPYGDWKLSVDTIELINQRANIYFADFYCMTTTQHHTITLVVTTPQSEADDFCQINLPQLSKFNNQFLYVDEEEDVVRVKTAPEITIELLICKDVHLNELQAEGKAKLTSIDGDSSLRHGGMFKRSDCRVCNIAVNRNKLGKYKPGDKQRFGESCDEHQEKFDREQGKMKRKIQYEKQCRQQCNKHTGKQYKKQNKQRSWLSEEFEN